MKNDPKSMQALVTAASQHLPWDLVMKEMVCEAVALLVHGHSAVKIFSEVMASCLKSATAQDLDATCLMLVLLDALHAHDTQQVCLRCNALAGSERTVTRKVLQ